MLEAVNLGTPAAADRTQFAKDVDQLKETREEDGINEREKKSNKL